MNLEEFLEEGRINLVVQGGGMRGTYSVAALDALDQLGYKERFSSVFATSSGAINAAYFLAGQAKEGIRAYTHFLSGKQFINKKRLGRMVDIDYLVDRVLARDVVLDEDRLRASPSRLHIGLLSATSGDFVFRGTDEPWPLLETFRAAAALPVLYGREVPLGDDFYVDGGLHSSLPIDFAKTDKKTKVLVIMTRPGGFLAKGPTRFERIFLPAVGRIFSHSPAVRSKLARFDHGVHLANTIDDASVFFLRPSREIVGRTTSEREELEKTALLGQSDVFRAIGK